MKRILISTRLEELPNYQETRQSLDVRWGEFVSAMGFLPIILPYNVEFELFSREVDFDAILLTGGNDLSCFSDTDLSVMRDKLEFQVIKYGLDNNLPILGVCRGMQILGDYYGCTFRPIKNHVSTNHTIYTLDVRLSDYDEVNSFHNYSIHQVTPDIEVLARSECGEIEAIAHKKERVMGLMWHPERNSPFSKLDINLIKQFFKD